MIDLMIPYCYKTINYSFVLIQVKNYACGSGVSDLKDPAAILNFCKNDLNYNQSSLVIYLYMQIGCNQKSYSASLFDSFNSTLLHGAILSGFSADKSPFIRSKAEEEALSQLSLAWADPLSLHSTSGAFVNRSAVLHLFATTLGCYPLEQIKKYVEKNDADTLKLFNDALL
jgi:hypothetical protein